MRLAKKAEIVRDLDVRAAARLQLAEEKEPSEAKDFIKKDAELDRELLAIAKESLADDVVRLLVYGDTSVLDEDEIVRGGCEGGDDIDFEGCEGCEDCDGCEDEIACDAYGYFTIAEYAKSHGIGVDINAVKGLEAEAIDISEDLQYMIARIDGKSLAFYEKVLDELFDTIFENDCDKCPCNGCEHCPAEQDEGRDLRRKGTPAYGDD